MSPRARAGPSVALGLALLGACSGPAGDAGSSASDGGAAPSGDGDAGTFASAADAASGTDASAAPALVTPVCDASMRCTLSSGGFRVVVDAAAGGRVLEVSLDGENALVTQAEESTAFGATFWTSPQSDWGWPPPAAEDSGPYAVSLDAGTLTLTSPEIALGTHRFVVTKALSVQAGSAALRVAYAVANTGVDAMSLAPWEVARVHAAGLTFFPDPAGGAVTFASASWTAMPTLTSDGCTFFPYDAAQLPADRKLFADGGAAGYLAHVERDLLLVRSFADVPAASRAPGEGEIEVYANAGHTYVELEVQGAYASLAPGARTSFVVTSALVRLPRALGDATAAASDPALRAMLLSAASAAASAAR